MSYTQIENVLGQPIPNEVVNQLKIRSKKTQGKRDDQALVYTANKSAWVRVVSSIDISGSLAGIRNEDQAYLAKNNVLFGGTSAYKKDSSNAGFTYELKPYYSQDAIDPVYGLRPMPGITSAKILTQGRLGSILVAEIDFKANTKAQLDLVDILYFKIGYTMLVEWGNTFYYKQKVTDANNDLQTDTTLYKSEDEALDPFSQGLSKESIRIKIANAVKKTQGNYGGMLGVVTNYSFTTNVDGGYDCKIKIMSPGMLAESMRVNGIQSLPQVYKDAIDQLAIVLTRINKTNAELERARENKDKIAEYAKLPEAYPRCVRGVLKTKLLISTSSAGVTAAAGIQTTGFKGFAFYYDVANPTNPTRGRYRNPEGKTGNYSCSDNGNIIDDDTKAILGEDISSINQFDLSKLFDKYNNPYATNQDKSEVTNLPAFKSGRYSTAVGSRYQYPSNIDLSDVRFVDTQDGSGKQYHYFSKQKNIIQIASSQIDEEELVDEMKVFSEPSSGTVSFNYSVIRNYIKSKNSYGIFLAQDLPLTRKEYLNTINTIDDREKVFEFRFNDNRLYLTGTQIAKVAATVTTTAGNPYLVAAGLFFGRNTDAVNNLIKNLKETVKTITNYQPGILYYIGTYQIAPDTYGAFSVGYKNEAVFQKDSRFKATQTQIDINMSQAQIEENFKTVESAISDKLAQDNLKLQLVQIISGVTDEAIRQPHRAYLRGDVSVDVWVPYQTIVQNASDTVRTGIQKMKATVPFFIVVSDFDSIASIEGAKTLDNPGEAQSRIPPDQPLEYQTIKADELAKSEASMYTSQLEAMLRVVQITTIANTVTERGILEDVKKITWTEGKYEKVLFDGLFVEGAMMSGTTSILRQVATSGSTLFTDQDKENYIKGNITNQLQKYKINLYYGFARNLMKGTDKDIFKELEKPEYKVNFKELLTSYVIPYYQSKTLVDGGDIHYPTYIPIGFFFMMLNHCSFLYDTSDSSINVPMFYLDFNPGTNIMLSSDFMLTSNPYKFVVPFTGDVESYKKLFDADLIKGDTIGSGSDSSKIWKLDAVSSYIPNFKYTLSGANNKTSVYRGKTMNVLVSIDYLLDIIKRHSQRDETNSVYFRPLIEELLGDLGKCLGSFNVFRLAYDDNANCFYVVDDEVIPGDQVPTTEDVAKISNMELPLFGKDSIAKTFTITTENSSKLGSTAFISANQDVKNQASLGIDGTSIGNLSLYAVDRYKRVTTAANGNRAAGSVATVDLQKKAVAASRFNEAVNSFYYGGLRSENMVDQATNYYIEAVARTRAGASESDEGIRATTLLPLTVNFSTDGISSMAIYQAFTINQELLPYSYKYGLGQSATKQIGFIITGLEHTIQNNTWTTDVKANMYYVKRLDDYKSVVKNMEKAPAFDDIPVALLQNDTNNSSAGSGIPASTYRSTQAAKNDVLATNDEIEAMKIWTRATEGLSLYAIWDINNWRTGYGSQNITIAETGKFYNIPKDPNKWPIAINRQTGAFEFKDITGLVQKDGQQFPNGKIWHYYMSKLAKVDIITQQDAEADLVRLITTYFLPNVVKPALSSRGIKWDSLSIPVKVAFYKTAYAYGNITQSGKWIVDAYVNGGQSAMAAAALKKASVPGNSDYGADKLAILLS